MIYWPTNIRSHTEFRLFIFDSLRVIICLAKSVFFIRHGWGKSTESCLKFCFNVCPEILVLVQKAFGNEALNRSNLFRWYSRFRDGMELVEGDERYGRPKSTWTEVNIVAVADLVKNDIRIYQNLCTSPSLYFFGFWKRILERESCVQVLFHTPWLLSKGKVESHLAKTLSQRPMQTFIF